MKWLTAHASVAGTAHRSAGSTCQDFAVVKRLSGSGSVLLAAVADGLGSAPLAAKGAELAALAFLNSAKRSRLLKTSGIPPIQMAESAARRIFADIRSRIDTYARRARLPSSAFATTFVGCLATPTWLVSLQVGDGFIVARSRDGTYRLFHPSDPETYANHTVAVTSPFATEALQISLLVEPISFIALGTDGLEDVALKASAPYLPFFSHAENWLKDSSPLSSPDAALRRFLESPDLAKKTRDDKTLILAVRSYSLAVLS